MKNDLARPSREAELTAPPGSPTSIRTASATLSGSASLVAVLVVALASRVLAAGVVRVVRPANANRAVVRLPRHGVLLAAGADDPHVERVRQWWSGAVSTTWPCERPGYPLFLAACQAVFGESPLAARLVQAALGTASVWLVYRLTRQVDATPEPEPRAACSLLDRAGARRRLGGDQSLLRGDVGIASFRGIVHSAHAPHALGPRNAHAERAMNRTARAVNCRAGAAGLVALLTGAAGGAAVLTRPSFALFPPAVLVGVGSGPHSRPRQPSPRMRHGEAQYSFWSDSCSS